MRRTPQRYERIQLGRQLQLWLRTYAGVERIELTTSFRLCLDTRKMDVARADGGSYASYVVNLTATTTSVAVNNGSQLTNVSQRGSSTSAYEIRLFQYYAWGVIGNIISSLGIVGNVLSMAVLCHRRMRTSTSVYLIALAIYDTLVLVSLVLCMALPTIHFRSESVLAPYMAIFPYIQPYAYPLALTAQTCSIYTTVGFTVERYIAVCYPLRAVDFCTISRAQRSVVAIFLSSVAYNVPRLFEYRTVAIVDPVTNLTYVTYDRTSLSRNALYQHVYFIYMNIFVMLLLPFAVLTALNIQLVRAVRKSSRTRGKQVSSRQRNENNLTVMLISVVAVFLVCQISSIFDNIFMATLDADVLDSEPFVKLTCVSSLMVITNSAVNFYLYCVFGEKFRRIFCQIFCRCLPSAGAYLTRQDTSFVQRSLHGSAAGAAGAGQPRSSIGSRSGSEKELQKHLQQQQQQQQRAKRSGYERQQSIDQVTTNSNLIYTAVNGNADVTSV